MYVRSVDTVAVYPRALGSADVVYLFQSRAIIVSVCAYLDVYVGKNNINNIYIHTYIYACSSHSTLSLA
jgi:hypothetical protein